MRCCRCLLACALLLAVALPAPAGLFGKRKKPEPAQRVPELVQILKADRDDRKRASAAEELRQYDAGQYPQIVPALVDALQGDPKPAVRTEAAHTLGKLRPVSQPAGQALEKAAGHDHSLRVRLQARTALMFYHMAGYSGANAKKGEPPPAPGSGPGVRPRTDEPPLGTPPTTAEPPLAAPQPTPPPPSPAPVAQPAPSPAPPASLYRPMPSSGPAAPPVPRPNLEDDGPVLGPQR